MRPVAAMSGLLFIALCQSSLAQSGAGAGADVEVAVVEGAPLRVQCALRVEERAQWTRDGAAPPADMRAAEVTAGAGLRATLSVPAARPAHAGRYACSPRAPAVRVRVLPRRAGPESSAPPAPAAAAPADDALDFAYTLGKQLQLNCTPPGPVDTSGVAFTWFVNGSALDESAQLKGRVNVLDGGARITVDRALEDDFGNYSCSADGQQVSEWRVRGKPLLRLPANVNVVEGQKIKITCRVIGKPYPAVSWLYRPMDSANYTVDARLAVAALGEGRATLAPSAAGVPDGELVLLAARREDAGLYSCATPGAEHAETALRVKDMYAALWPFLGICAEVFVLCAIILVYEKRRTKPECEDSDTDNHEQ